MGTGDKHFGAEAIGRFDGPGSCLRGGPYREVYFHLLTCTLRNLQRLFDSNMKNRGFLSFVEV